MIRFVIALDGESKQGKGRNTSIGNKQRAINDNYDKRDNYVVPDIFRRLPGRGHYVVPSAEVLKRLSARYI